MDILKLNLILEEENYFQVVEKLSSSQDHKKLILKLDKNKALLFGMNLLKEGGYDMNRIIAQMEKD